MAGPLAPLAARLGLEAGRLAPRGWTPAEGSYAFVLGSDVAGVRRRLAVGDFFQVEQPGSLAGVTFVRLRAHVRPPASAPPAGLFWRLDLLVDEVVRVSRVLGRELDRYDLALPASALPGGDHLVAARLTLGGPAGVYEVELPAVYLDAVLLDAAAATPGLINRDPEPYEDGVPLDSSIVLELSSTNGAAVDVAATEVFVGGALAFAGGVFQPGFTGPDSAQDATIDAGLGLRLVIDPLVTLPAQATVPVLVRSRVVGAPATVDATYTFRTEDTIAPRLKLLRPTSRRTLLAQFTEQVRQESATAPGDALNPTNWTVTAQLLGLGNETPAAPLTVASAAPAPDGAKDTVELTFSDDMTPGALYLLEALHVTDLAGNPIITPANAGLFYGFIQQAPPGRDFRLEDMLPALNVAEDETRDLTRFLACVQEPLDGLLGDVDAWGDILDPDTAPERFVDVMLADLGNPFPFELDLAARRGLVQVLVPLYAQKGTDTGIINAVRFFLGVEVTIELPAFEAVWSLGDAELGVGTLLGTSNAKTRYSFLIRAPRTLTAAERRRVEDIAAYMRRECTHLLAIEEPAPPPPTPDHVELGLSELGGNWLLH